MLNFKKSSRIIILVSIALIAVLGVVFALNKTWATAQSSAPYPATEANNTATGGDGGENTPNIPGSWQLISKADLNRDGKEEPIYLDKSQMEVTSYVELHVLDISGNEVWNASANSAHAGWDSLFLCELDGKSYLLRYNPTMYQGYCNYTYTLFTLEGGKENIAQRGALEFDINGTKELNVPEMVSFADEVNALLGKSTLLMSTEGGDFAFGPSAADAFLERYSWLNGMPGLDSAGGDLAARLTKYSESAVANRKKMEDSNQ